MGDLNAVDMSRWGGELTPTEAACMATSGIHTVIVATGPGGYGLMALQQAEAADAAGMTVEAYVFLEFDSDPIWWVRESVARLEDFPVARWWLDIEDTENGQSWTPAQRLAYAGSAAIALDNITGKRAGIYTGGWYWRAQMGNAQLFSLGRLLWNSYYDDGPAVNGLPYGGWTAAQVAIEQYQGTAIVCGQSVDKNHVYIEPEEDMPDPRVDNILRLLGEAQMAAWLAKGNVPLLDAFANEQVARGEATNSINAHIANHPSGILAGVTPEDIANAITGGAKFAADGIRFAAQRGSGG